MKLSTKTIYSLRLMVYLADRLETGKPVRLKEAAEAQGLPYKYLEQLAKPLKAAGLVRSEQGKQGGYVAARAAGEITALEVAEAAAGPLELLGCAGAEADCGTGGPCPAGAMWRLVESRVRETLAAHTLEDLSEKAALESFTGGADSGAARISCVEKTKGKRKG